MSQNNLSENLNHWDYIDKYSLWMYHIYENYIGSSVFEIGAGQGRNVTFYLSKSKTVVAADIFQDQIDYMNQKFRDFSQFQALMLNVEKDDLIPFQNSFDTVICINVLEHLENDFRSVDRMKSLLIPGGNMIILVPAFQKLYCQLDKNVGHYRRYDPGRLEEIARASNMKIIEHHYFNRLGIIPYWIKGKRKVNENESFSSSLNETNSRLYNIASVILEPIEKRFPPKKGLSEFIVLNKSLTEG